MKKGLVFTAILLFLGGLFSLQSQPTPNSSAPNKIAPSPKQDLTSAPTEQVLSENLGAEREVIKVSRVIDGDTIELVDGRRVRYIGIDTPETVDPRKPVECFGREAAAKNRELVEGKTIEMEKDVSETDKYGRLLRYIYVPSISSGLGDNLWINEYLVSQGFAFSSSYPPDIKYQERLLAAQKEAQEGKRGLWESCPQKQNDVAVGKCQIKGNISSKGEKIYHLPNCPYWSKTVISEEKGERWFCSEDEAQVAGWRRAQNCP